MTSMHSDFDPTPIIIPLPVVALLAGFFRQAANEVSQ